MNGRSVAAVGLAVASTVGLGIHAWRQRRRQVVGFVKGQPVMLTAEGIDGKLVELGTADAFRRMRAAAALAGVKLKVVSGFRTMAEQEYLFACYINGGCNNGNYAERPGYSNHQSGHALDLNTRTEGVDAWMRLHGWEFGFKNTISSEPWHWEYWDHGV
jgi:LAS superfamily LD-carboxypeptidase LdcB